MDIVITGRRTEVTDRFRRLAEEKLAKVSQLSPSAYRIDVELSHERNPRQSSHCERVEITVRDKGPVIRAEACAEESFAALDIAFGKLLERLRRMGDRKKVHHGRHAPASVRGTGVLANSEAAANGLPASGSGGGVGVAVAERDGQQGGSLLERSANAFSQNGHSASHGHASNGNSANGNTANGNTANGHRHDSELRAPAGDPAFDELADLMKRADLPEGAEDLADSPVVIRTKDHTATPMTIDQALYEMELVGHDFYLFVDAACSKPSVVYRRRGWNYGVIRLDVLAEEPVLQR